MRKKLISKTYLRDVDKYNLKIIFEDEYSYSVKEIKKIKNPFILNTGVCLIDNGYYIMEIIPYNENYSIRVYFDNKKNILEYYIDISLENGIDEDTKIPYYDDLFTDITITNGEIEILDEDELLEALNNKVIRKKDFKLANDTRDKLLEEIKTNTNKYLNMDLKNML